MYQRGLRSSHPSRVPIFERAAKKASTLSIEVLSHLSFPQLNRGQTPGTVANRGNSFGYAANLPFICNLISFLLSVDSQGAFSFASKTSLYATQEALTRRWERAHFCGSVVPAALGCTREIEEDRQSITSVRQASSTRHEVIQWANFSSISR